MAIEIIHGRLPEPNERAYREMMHYQSDQAEKDAAATPGDSDEPWENVIRLHEPLSHYALDWITSHPELGNAVRGKVLDIAAGSCWLTGLTSKRDTVDGVWALDLSERFLTETGLRIIRRLQGNEEKVRFAVGDFNHMPFADNFFDCGFLFSALHHSLSPVSLLREAIRCIRPGGSLFVLESPRSVLTIPRDRQHSLLISARAVTELCYTKAELEYIVRFAAIPFPGEAGAHCEFHRLPSPHPKPVKEAVKLVLRALHMEDFVKPPTYVIQVIPGG
jgi:SAM-dependent methyltransferase